MVTTPGQLVIRKVVVDNWQSRKVRIIFVDAEGKMPVGEYAILAVAQVISRNPWHNTRHYSVMLHPNRNVTIVDHLYTFLKERSEDLADEILDIYDTMEQII